MLVSICFPTKGMHYVKFYAFSVVRTFIMVLWIMTPHSLVLVYVYQSKRTYCFHDQDVSSKMLVFTYQFARRHNVKGFEVVNMF